jgi:hypothetical protein
MKEWRLKMTLDHELSEIIEGWKKFLLDVETKMVSSIDAVLNEVIKNSNIFVIFFEYEYDLMDLSFFAFDDKENTLLVKHDILTEEINCKTLFPKDLLDKQYELTDEYDGVDENFDEIYAKYEHEKEDIFKRWFKGCWNNAIKVHKNIPQAYFSIHDTNWKYNLETDEKTKGSEIFNKG